MKKALSIIIFISIYLNGFAQTNDRLINQTEGQNGHVINYITAQTLIDGRINHTLNLKEVLNNKTLEETIRIWGEPINIKSEQDVANDGTVLFERKMGYYPGLRLIFPEKNGKYVLSRIDFITNKSNLKLGDTSFSLGMEVDKLLPTANKIKSGEGKRDIDIRVLETDHTGKIKKTDQGVFQSRSELLKIETDSAGRIRSMSLLMYTI
ncbi:hypothetical protein [Gracilimonas mengyeensis]|uniref:Uncharacterized protein n=1 Tax=Gracilimonas mengyeensis TaxID=1302730 RepID=A0A521CPV2_9BACT|nr:hypothetical protein [Gracilimonas mengyeensis]SMO61487.1 hypothetical protein SAMN06265219_10651 [Gracilimonas mengyeensis]